MGLSISILPPFVLLKIVQNLHFQPQTPTSSY